jgi:hypothetical protein
VTFKQHVPPLFFGDKVEPETKSAELTKVAVPHLLVSIRQRFSNCGARPPGGAPLVLWAEEGWGGVDCIKDIFILNSIQVQGKIYILIGT